MAKAKKKWTATDLKRRIEGRHPPQKAWFTATELCPVCGSWGSAGSIDAVAVCLSSGRDFSVHGFEVKIARGDWLSELNNPAKSDIATSEVDFWWIVAPSTDVVHIDELPAKWGLYTCSGSGLRVTKRALRLHEKTQPFSRSFIASLLWKVTRYVPPTEKEIDDARKEGRAGGIEEGERRANSDRSSDHEELQELRHLTEEYEKRAGHHLSDYNVGELAAVAKLMMNGYFVKSARARIGEMLKTLQAADTQLKAGLEHVTVDEDNATHVQ